MSTQILIFGDSVAEGFWDTEGGWAQRLRDFMNKRMLADKNFWCVVRNLGLSGNTSRELINRFTPETRVRIKEGDKPLIIFGIGVNDASYFKKIRNPKVPEKEFIRNIGKLMAEAKKFADHIIFLAATPVDEQLVYFKPWGGAFGYKYFYSNERIEDYNSIIREVCKKNRVYFLDTPAEFRRSNYKRFLHDGLHPNSKGHELIFRDLKRFITVNKIVDGL